MGWRDKITNLFGKKESHVEKHEFYLQKQNKKHVHYLRLTLDGSLLTKEEGVLYVSRRSQTKRFADSEAAFAACNALIHEHNNKGYELTSIPVIVKRSSDVYDKAKWHYDGNFPAELAPYQGYVHIGFYFGWLIDRDLISEALKTENADDINAFLARKMTAVKFLERLDGVLSIEMLNAVGNEFSLAYYDYDAEKDAYSDDYFDLLAKDLPTLYHVQDTWENFMRISQVIDARFAAWSKKISSLCAITRFSF